jgi:hypothetical protein
VGSLDAQVLLDDTNNQFLTLGGDTGLRGYVIGDRLGKSRFLGNLEVRSMALKLSSLRLGGLVFWDVGDAGSPNSPETTEGGDLPRAFHSLLGLTPHHSVGMGLRLLIPQLNSNLIRLDWAFAIRDTMHTRAGWPGRISLGFQQTF